MSNIDQLRTPIDGDTSSSGAPATVSRQPLVDLTSLAPENQQGVNQVTEGWKEGTTDQGKALDSSPLSPREIAHKIHGILDNTNKVSR